MRLDAADRPSRPVAWSVAAYRLGVVLLPRRLRRRHAADLIDLFALLAGDAYRRAGLRGLASAWVRSIVDVCRRAPVEHRFERRYCAPPFPDREAEPMFGSLLHDLRQAGRVLLRAPLSTGLIVVTLALGIGVNAATFSVVNAVLVAPLGYPEPDRLVVFHGKREGAPTPHGTISYLNFVDVRASSSSYSAASAYDEWRPTLTGDGADPERVEGAQVNVEFFRVLGVEPAHGRFFADGEDRDGDDSVVVLSHGLWTRRYGADPAVVGRTIEVSGRSHEVVGVAPAQFEDPLLSGAGWARPEIWRPLGFDGLPVDDQPSRGSSSYTAVGRLAPGVSIEAARDELDRLMAGLERQYPDNNPGVGMTLVPLHERMVGDARASILLIQAAVAAVLAIASINVGGLLLSGAAERRREMAIRSALGADRWRIARALVGEVMLMALLAGALALVGARAMIVGLVALGGASVPRGDSVGIDAQVMMFTALASLLVGLLCALAPLAMLWRSGVGDAMRPGARVSGAGGNGRRRLVTAQVALSLVLLVGALMLGRSLWNLTRVDPGFETSQRLVFNVALPFASYPELAERSAFMAGLLDALEGTAGVESAATINILPLSGSFDCTGFWATDRPRPGPNEAPCPQVRTVSPGYFETMRIELVAGRLLSPDDGFDDDWVGVVNETFLAQLWPGEDPIGRTIVNYQEIPVRVVGVVRGVKHRQLNEPAEPALYIAYDQNIVPWHLSRATVVVKTGGDPRALVGLVRERVRELDPRLPISSVSTLDAVVRESVSSPRYRAVLVGSFAVLAIVLATVGIYGMVTVTVARQRRDLAVRSALGARARDLRRQVLWHGLVPVITGALIGLPATLLAGRAMAGMLFEVAPVDPSSLVAVTLFLLLVASISTWSPARRAARTEPVVALREE